MQVSKKKVNAVLEKQLYSTLWQLVVDLKNPKDVELVLSDLLSTTEIATVAKRLAVAYWLFKKRSYENIPVAKRQQLGGSDCCDPRRYSPCACHGSRVQKDRKSVV